MRTASLSLALALLLAPMTSSAATPVNLTCMQQAVAVRESAMLTAFSTYTQTVMAAFQTRMTGLQSAWTIQDEESRKNTIKNIWTTYKNALKNAQKQLQNSRKSVWKTFKDSRKTCGGSSLTDPGGGESVDASL